MSIVDTIKYAFKRALRRKVEKKIDKEVEKAVDKVVDKAIDSANKKEETPVEKTETVAEGNEVKAEDIESKQAELIKALNERQTATAKENAMGIKEANEILAYLIFDDDMKVIGVKDDAPDYLKTAFKNGELNK